MRASGSASMMPAHERLERRGVALPRLHGRLPGEDGPRQHEGRLALLRAQVGVTRAFGQTVSLAHDGTADDGHVHVQVGHHALDDGELLGVLLPEKSAMRLHDVEELRDHRAHAAEVPRARGAAQRVGERFHDHEGVVGRGVHVVHFRVEDDVDAVALADARIALEIARVGLVVLARSELDGVDEYRDDDAVARRAGGRP